MADFRGGNDRGEARHVGLPLLDRLLDEAPEAAADPAPSPLAAMATLRRGVKRDLEALLNTRRRWRSWPERLTELALSSVGYGIADFAAGAFNDARQRDRLRGEIEAAIRLYEPRLSDVRVRLLGAPGPAEPVLRLVIDAVLHAEPSPEPIAFETLFDATTAEVSLSERTPREPTDV